MVRCTKIGQLRLVNDPDYRAALKDFNTFIETLQQRVIELDETIPDLPSKDVVRTNP